MAHTRWNKNAPFEGGVQFDRRSELGDGEVRCHVCGCPAKLRKDNASRVTKHKDGHGHECPNRVNIIEYHFDELPPVRVPGAQNSPREGMVVTGACYDCGKPISGERFYCGQCLAAR